MKRSRFSDEQIIGMLKEHAAGMATADLCRKHGFSSATFYKWKAKFGGTERDSNSWYVVLSDELEIYAADGLAHPIQLPTPHAIIR
jgi:putative transposase